MKTKRSKPKFIKHLGKLSELRERLWVKRFDKVTRMLLLAGFLFLMGVIIGKLHTDMETHQQFQIRN